MHSPSLSPSPSVGSSMMQTMGGNHSMNNSMMSSPVMNNSMGIMNHSSMMMMNGSTRYQPSMMHNMSKNGSMPIHSMHQSKMMSSMASQMQRCACGPASQQLPPKSSMYYSIKPSHAMSSKMMKPSSSIFMEEPAKNKTCFNSPDGYIFKQAVAIQSFDFKSGSGIIEMKTSSKSKWETLASASLAQSVVIQSGGSIRY